jgi:WD40 repeat protein
VPCICEYIAIVSVFRIWPSLVELKWSACGMWHREWHSLCVWRIKWKNRPHTVRFSSLMISSSISPELFHRPFHDCTRDWVFSGLLFSYHSLWRQTHPYFWLVSGYMYGGTWLMFNPRMHGTIAATLSGHSSWVLCLSCSPYNGQLATGSSSFFFV